MYQAGSAQSTPPNQPLPPLPNQVGFQPLPQIQITPPSREALITTTSTTSLHPTQTAQANVNVISTQLNNTNTLFIPFNPGPNWQTDTNCAATILLSTPISNVEINVQPSIEPLVNTNNNNAPLVNSRQNEIAPQRPRNKTPSYQDMLRQCTTKEDVEKRCVVLLNQAKGLGSSEEKYSTLGEMERTACQWMLSSNKQELAKIVFAKIDGFVLSEQLGIAMGVKNQKGFEQECITILNQAQKLPEDALTAVIDEFKKTAEAFKLIERHQYARTINAQLAVRHML